MESEDEKIKANYKAAKGVEKSVLPSGPYPKCPNCEKGEMLPLYSNDQLGERLDWRCNSCGNRT